MGGVAAVRSVAHGFNRGGIELGIVVSPLQRARESFLSPVKTGSQFDDIRCPTPKGVGYGSYAGYADEIARARRRRFQAYTSLAFLICQSR
ncbi:MAG: hypothetical protein QOD64_2172 [Verrucomicrobiota bacterium]|jgi:hypothetical protein